MFIYSGKFFKQVYVMITPIPYGSREGTIQKYFANPKKYFKSQYFSPVSYTHLTLPTIYSV